jgi:hypothetical protein
VSLVHPVRQEKALERYNEEAAAWRERVGGDMSSPMTADRIRLVECPSCHAPAESHCSEGGKPRKANHQARMQAVRAWMSDSHPRYPSSLL